MKGFLKGLRYFSQMFEEEEKEEEIQIGYPTDVKHVAHIGWDGPSASSPSWMTEFKSSPASGDANKDPEDLIKSVTRDSAKKSGVSGLPKSSRRQGSADSVGSMESPGGSPTHKSTTKSSKRRSKQNKENASPKPGESSNSQKLPHIPKKSTRKKSKDEDSNRTSKTKEKGSRRGTRQESHDGSVANSEA